MTAADTPETRLRLRRTAWSLVVVIFVLFLGSACFILFNGHKSRTVLHSEVTRATRFVA